MVRHFLALILVLTACGKAPEPNKIDDRALPYLSKFTQEIGENVVNLDIIFTHLNYPTLGECQLGPINTIRIDESYWNRSDDDAREELMLHELGHCVLLLGHINDLNEYNCPTSIMNKYTFGNSKCYQDNKSYYYQELKSRKK